MAGRVLERVSGIGAVDRLTGWRMAFCRHKMQNLENIMVELHRTAANCKYQQVGDGLECTVPSVPHEMARRNKLRAS